LSTIAIDVDGVLLDYNAAYAIAWESAFGALPDLKNPDAYWAKDRWRVEHLTGSRLEYFRSYFDESFWSSLPAYEGAIDACLRLKSAGYNLVCVSAINPCFRHAREKNLQKLGFPIERVFCTEEIDGSVSPKASALAEIAPVAFVDDYLPFMRGIPSEIHAALILRDSSGSPNVGAELSLVDSRHECFAQFADWWLARSIPI
jgi:5' nucleotidase, deoxy (Pyrimidine), cytosolic type C protein (NT5C).